MAKVEIDEVLRFYQTPGLVFGFLHQNAAAISQRDRCQGLGNRTVGDEASKIAADNAVPCRPLPLIECFLDVLRNILSSFSISKRIALG